MYTATNRFANNIFGTFWEDDLSWCFFKEDRDKRFVQYWKVCLIVRFSLVLVFLLWIIALTKKKKIFRISIESTDFGIAGKGL